MEFVLKTQIKSLTSAKCANITRKFVFQWLIVYGTLYDSLAILFCTVLPPSENERIFGVFY